VGWLARRWAWLGCGALSVAHWGCASEAPAPSLEVASAAPSGSAPRPLPPVVDDAIPPLLLDTRAPDLPTAVDPIVATVEALPAKFACATLSARGLKLRNIPKRTADAYAKCKTELEAGGPDVRGCLMLSELLHDAPRDEVLSDNIATRACARANSQACRMLAESRLGSGVRFDPICAEQIFQTLCTEGEHTACFRLGALTLEGELVVEDVVAGKRLIQRACDGGAYMACLDIVMRDKGSDDEARQIVERAFQFATKACADDDAAACLELGWAYAHSGQWFYLATPAKNEAKQLELTQRACTLGSPDACARLERHERTDPYKDLCEEEPEACTSGTNTAKTDLDDWMGQRCAAGSDGYCDSLTRNWRRAPPTPQQVQSGTTWLEPGCLAGAAGACEILSAGRLVATVPSEKVLIAGCDLGLALSCSKLAERAQASGDRGAELQYLERACPVVTPQGRKSTSRSACRRAGLMYKDGVGAPRDLTRAAILLQKGCKQQRYVLDGEACAALGTMYEDGIGLPKSLSRALDLYAAGCADEGYLEEIQSRAESRSRAGRGPMPPPKPAPKHPTACSRLRKWIEPPKGSP